jgi:shikimate dehydrogenase
VRGGTKLAGAIGWPIAQSLSPHIHSHWLRELGLDGAYVPLPVAREDFARAIDGLRRAGFVGLNVTLPHKQAAFAISDRLDEAAQLTGAVNLVLFGQDGRIEGRNTDVEGLRDSIVEEFGANIVNGKTVVVLGAGGAARSAVIALEQLGAVKIYLVNRDELRAKNLAAELQPRTKSVIVPLGWDQWPRALEHTTLLVNATTGGMQGAAALDISLNGLPAEAAVYDLVYNPVETELVKNARAQGHRAANGLGMLLHQAIPAFAAFYGVTPRLIPELRAELEQVLSV